MKFLKRLFRRKQGRSVIAWAARDRVTGKLWGYPYKPRRAHDGYWYSFFEMNDWIVCPLSPFNNIPVLADLKPEDEPVKVKLTLEVLD